MSRVEKMIDIASQNTAHLSGKGPRLPDRKESGTLCPYCGKRAVKGLKRKTCGAWKCQFDRHKEAMRIYWFKYKVITYHREKEKSQYIVPNLDKSKHSAL